MGEVSASIKFKTSPISLNDSNASSPASTPRSRMSKRNSPVTPKTVLLDERTREVHNLKTELENERYEKSLLEVQIKENELKIRQLMSNYKREQQRVKELKNDLNFTVNEQNNPPSANSEEQHRLTQRFSKELEEKENEISILKSSIGTLRDEKSLLKEKLHKLEEHIKMCMVRIQEADTKVFELCDEMEEKTTAMKYLQEHNSELERYISELLGSKSGSDCNRSSDYLDTSFARLNSTQSPSMSPENLGCSVIDLQLREKICENSQLREQLESFQEKNLLLVKQIQEIAQMLENSFKIPIDNMLMKPTNEDVDSLDCFLSLSISLKELNHLYQNDLQTMRIQEENAKILCEKNTALNAKIQDLEQKLDTNKDRVDMLENVHSELLRERQEMENKLKACNEVINELDNCKCELEKQFENVSRAYEEYKTQSEREKYDIQAKLNNMAVKLESQMDKNKNLMKNISALQKSLQETKEESNQHKTTVEQLNEKLTNLQQELASQKLGEAALNEIYEKTQSQIDKYKKRAKDTDLHMESMRKALDVKESEMKKVGAEISGLRVANADLEARANNLTAIYEQQKEKHKEICEQMKQQITEKNAQLQGLTNELQTVIAKLENYHKLLLLPLLEGDSVNLEEGAGKLQTMKTMLENYSKEQESLQNQLKELQQQRLKEAEKNKNDLEIVLQQLESLQKEQIQLSNQNDELIVFKEKYQNLEELNKMTEIKLKTTQEAQSQLKTKFSSLLEKLKAQNARHEKTVMMKEKLEEKLIALQQQLLQQQVKCEQLQELYEAEVESKIKLGKTLQQERAEHEISLKNLEQKHTENVAHQENLKKEWQIEAAHWKENLEHLKSLFESEQQQQMITVQQLKVSVEKIRSELANRELCYDELKTAHGNLQIEYENLQVLHTQMLQDLDNQQQTAFELEQQHQAEYMRIIAQQRTDLHQQQCLMQTYDATLYNMLVTLENTANLTIECEGETLLCGNMYDCDKNTYPNLQQLKRNLGRLLHRINNKQAEIEEYKNKQIEYEKQEANVRNKLQQTEQQAKAAVAQIEQLKAQLLQQKTAHAQIQEQLLTQKDLKEHLESQVNELVKLNTTMEQKLSALTEAFDACLSKKQKAEHKRVEFNIEYDKVLQQITETKDRIQYLESYQANSEEIINKLKSQNASLKELEAKQKQRIEKYAVQLGEVQGERDKLARELQKTNESKANSLETLQREKEVLDNELKTHKQLLLQAQTVQAELNERLKSSQKAYENLKEKQKKLQAEGDEIKVKISKYEKIREDKLRELEVNCYTAEREAVNLQLEIGALNLELTKKATVIKEQENLHKDLQKELQILYENLKISKELEENQRRELEILKSEKAELVKKEDYETLKLKYEQETQKLQHYEQQKIELELHLSTVEKLLLKEQEINAQIRTDNQILQTKYAESKQRLQEELVAGEERVKEKRLELEGKLEKMKHKMVSYLTQLLFVLCPHLLISIS